MERARPIDTHKFRDIPIGSYFTMKFGLLWRKVSDMHAADVWSGRVIYVDSEVACRIQD